MSKHSRPQKLLAEFAGTFAVVLVSAGAPVVAAPGSLAVAIAYGAAYGASVAALGRISGGHFNPAVTVAHWTTHRLGLIDTLLYAAAQLGGASAAAYALRLPVPASDAAVAALLAPPALASGVTRGPAMLIEAAMTFALVLALWATIAGRARPRYWLAGIAAGIVVAAASFAGTPYTGGAMNPARAFGPALAAAQWAYQPVYWIGPLAGGVAAAFLYDLLFRRTPVVHPQTAL
jgi:MIP family channel proteins